MASDVTQIEKLAQRPLTLDLAAIEGEFDKIWRESAGPGQDQSSIRLRMLNFVAIGPEKVALDRFEEVMAVMPQRHPCRGILLATSPLHSRIEASISAHCWRAVGGGRHVCSEEVLLQGGIHDGGALASAALALLVAELPVFLWLIGVSELGDPLVAQLIDAADRVFVDSAGADDLAATLQSVLRAHELQEVSVIDLAWCRMATWRALTAQFFDSREGAVELAQLQGIEIVSGGTKPGSEALLLAGWFVSRLGLTLADLDRTPRALRATFYGSTRAVTLKVSCEAGRDEGLNTLRLTTPNAGFSLEVHEESAHIHVRADWKEAPMHRTVEQVPMDDASIFTEALDDRSDPTVFVEALRSTLTLLADAAPGR